jgi:thiol-disulfide isomerase/thioredoxin
MSKQPLPYASFGSYNINLNKDSNTPSNPLTNKSSIRENYKNQREFPEFQSQASQNAPQNVYQNAPQNVYQNAPHNVQQNAHQNVQQNAHQKISRFKDINSSEHLYNVLVNGLENFRTNFKKNRMEPPPMKIFLKLYTDWCGPCKKISPALDDMSMMEEYKDIFFMKCNADLIVKGEDQHSKQLSKMLKIGAVPMFYGFIDGQMVGNVTGIDLKEIQQLLSMIKS